MDTVWAGAFIVILGFVNLPANSVADLPKTIVCGIAIVSGVVMIIVSMILKSRQKTP